jgi:hypothetical protein
MNRNNRPARKSFIALFVIASLCLSNFGGLKARAQFLPGGKGVRATGKTAIQANKIKDPGAPPAKFGGRLDKLSPDLAEQLIRSVNRKKIFRVICRFNAPAGSGVEAIYTRPRVRVNYAFQNSSIVSAEMPATDVFDLTRQAEISYITPDREVRTLGHVSATTGTDLVRTQATVSST